ncbi:hypothetical protein PV08_00013 [Exophiala spinifera]|uniref:Enoyl reductase (ER) domain-containing protein n=1 Tax=Exophiala spinifera TaxID=91928 RepID=A0A0D1YVZ3_9EURO|nr:uncharacterized protein PV08_00013 [Exophiala spinifera]KIW19441.1 hypothetical protein PV08_00013 [Exophiala spinifera]
MHKSTTVLLQVAQASAVIEERPLPVLGDNESLVKVEAVALNPYDWKMLYGRTPPVPTVLGCDFAGVVEAVGAHVCSVKPGDRVAGMTMGGNTLRPQDGAFATYLVAPTHALLHLPDDMSFENGATLPTPVFTAGFCLYHQLSLPYPDRDAVFNGNAPTLLVYGGATSIGLMLIQMAKLTGMRVLTVCSRQSAHLAEAFGADAVFDYSDHNCENDLRNETGGNIQYTVDCISDHQSAAICAAAMGCKSGFYISLTANGPTINARDVQTIKIVGFTILGREFSFGFKGVASPVVEEDVAFATQFAVLIEQFFSDDKIKPLRAEVRVEGLSGIVSGLNDLREGKVHGKRLVYQTA